MARRLPRLSTLSLLPFVAAAALWARSFRHGDWLTFNRTTNELSRTADTEVTEYAAFSGNGVLHLRRLHYRWYYGIALHHGKSNGWDHAVTAPNTLDRPKGAPTPPTWPNRLGFAFTEVHYTTPEKPGMAYDVAFPLWLPLLLLALHPASRAYRRLRRPGYGHCPQCGYDLRATPDRCPECGAGASVRNKT